MPWLPVTRLEWTPALGEPGSHATVMRFGMPGRQRAGLAHCIPIDATDQTAVSVKGQPAGLARQGAKRPRSPAESTSEPGRRPEGPGGQVVRCRSKKAAMRRWASRADGSW